MTTETKRDISPAMHALFLALTAGGVLALGTIMGLVGGANAGYSGLVRPTYTPPDAVFSAVWTVLYLMMGASLYLTIAAPAHDRATRVARTAALVLFALQLAVNVTWPLIFFKAKMMFFAFIWLAILDALVTALVVVDFRLSKGAALLILPYLAWSIFATVLNVMMAIYN